MPDPSLHGNGKTCPGCALRREADPWKKEVDCNICGGTGRIAFTVMDVYQRQLAEARKYYWSTKTYA